MPLKFVTIITSNILTWQCQVTKMISLFHLLIVGYGLLMTAEHCHAKIFKCWSNTVALTRNLVRYCESMSSSMKI